MKRRLFVAAAIGFLISASFYTSPKVFQPSAKENRWRNIYESNSKKASDIMFDFAIKNGYSLSDLSSTNSPLLDTPQKKAEVMRILDEGAQIIQEGKEAEEKYFELQRPRMASLKIANWLASKAPYIFYFALLLFVIALIWPPKPKTDLPN
jgi:hypothetical protein